MFTVKSGILVEFDKYGLGDGVENITIPNGVTKIGARTFQFCRSIKTVVIPDSVTEIEDSAFAYCAALAAVHIPNSVVKIGALAFAGCSALKKISLPSNLSVIETGCFSGCSALADICFPNHLTLIKKEAFERCTSLVKVNLPDSVTTLESAVFKCCSSLTTIVVSANLNVCTGAFCECENLVNYENIANNASLAIINDALCTKDGSTLLQCLPHVAGEYKISEGVRHIADYAFSNMTKLTSVLLPEECTVAPTAFAECSGLANEQGIAIVGDVLIKYVGDESRVIIPDYVKVISKYAFYENSTVEEVVFSRQLIEIQESAFAQCTALKRIELPYYLKELGTCAFDRCSSLEYISIPGNVKEIPFACFSGCSSLKEVILHEGLERICDEAFSGCEELHELKFPHGIMQIGSIFSGNEPIERVFVPATVNEINEFGFGIHNLEWYVQSVSYAKRFAQQDADIYNFKIIDMPAECFNAKDLVPDPYIIDGSTLIAYIGSGEETVAIPDGITTIKKGAFAACDIKTVVIPECVTLICAEAFYNCGELKNVVVLSSTAKIEVGAFGRCANLQKVIVPSSNVEFETGAFYKNEADWLLYKNRKICLYCANNPEIVQFAFSEKVNYAIMDDPLLAPNAENLLAACNNFDHKIVDTSVFTINGNVLVKVDDASVDESGKVLVPQGIKIIGEDAFRDTRTIKEIVLHDGVEIISKNAFTNCSAETIIIPSSVTRIDEYAFSGSFIRSISIPPVQTIAPYTFFECSFLSRVEFSDVLIEIGESAFSQCGSLRTIDLPRGLVEIKENAFSGCSGLLWVSLPNSVVSIGDNSFRGIRSHCVFMCDEQTEAYKYAQAKYIPATPKDPQVIEQINLRESLVANQIPVSFNYCGVDIELTANYKIYYQTIMHYVDLADDLFQGFVDDYSGLIGNFSRDKALRILRNLETESGKAACELHKLGVYPFGARDRFLAMNAGTHAIAEQLKIVLPWMTNLLEAKTEAIASEGNAIIAEASSKITGLSYGIITSSPLLMAAHAVDEYRARTRQRHAASAQAKAEIQKMGERLDSQMLAVYTDTMENQVYPAIKGYIQMFAEEMLKLHMHYLEIFDILPEKMLEVYDIEKSNKLIEAELSSPQQKIPTLVKALAHCPHNIRVYERLLAENADLATLKQIAVLVGIDQELEACGQKIQREQEQRRLLEQQRREEAVLAAQRRLEQQRLAQEAARKDAERARINSEICELEQELASLKGLFVGKRKKEINQEIASLREKLEAI